MIWLPMATPAPTRDDRIALMMLAGFAYTEAARLLDEQETRLIAFKKRLAKGYKPGERE